MIRLLHDHLHSLQEILVENLPPPISMFLPPSLYGSSTSDDTSSSKDISKVNDRDFVVPSTMKHSRVVPLEYLQDLMKDSASKESKNDIKQKHISLRDMPTQSSAESSFIATGTSLGERHVVSISISQYMAYDFIHSCNKCSKYVQGNPNKQSEFLTSHLPSRNGGEGINIEWCIPANQQKHCVLSNNRKTLERLRLSTMKLKGEKISSCPMTPVFTPTIGRDSSGLFNLFHSQFYHLHILVTSVSNFNNYCKVWPNHIIMALPDREGTGLGKHNHQGLPLELQRFWNIE